MDADVAVIGTGVMGSNLARNLARQAGARVVVYDRDVDRARTLAEDFPDAGFVVAASPVDLADKLVGPRVAILMVNAGAATDSAIDDLAEVFSAGDIIVDGGNSAFTDTIARGRRLQAGGIDFSGVGISGGEVGALRGPSMMVGGSKAAWQRLRPLLEPIAARAENVDGTGATACVAHVGSDGAGHFVKMVHNGIEYADMQLIAETATLLREELGLTPPETAEVFRQWNRGELESYLIEVTAEVLDHVDVATGRPFVDIVADVAGAKGTGAWTVGAGLDLAVPVPTIAEAVFSRSLSAAADLRPHGPQLGGPEPDGRGASERQAVIGELGQALLLGKVMAYVQGFHTIAVGAREHGWDTDLGELASIWRAGCIIRARFLNRVVTAFDRARQLPTLLADPGIREIANRSHGSLRATVVRAAESGIAAPALSSTLAYYDGLRAAHGSASLIQAQRDFFGSHTYSRTDRPGTFHTLWSGDRSEIELGP